MKTCKCFHLVGIVLERVVFVPVRATAEST
jgi:hypothetical protein